MNTADVEDIRARLEDAHVVPAALALLHLSGDLGVLDEIAPYIRDAWDYSAKFPEETAASIRDRLAVETARVAAGGAPALPHADTALIRRMMSVAVNEDVPEEYVPMALEQIGLSSALDA